MADEPQSTSSIPEQPAQAPDQTPPPAPPEEVVDPVVVTDRHPQSGRNKALIAVAVLVLLAGAAAVYFLFFKPGAKTPSSSQQTTTKTKTTNAEQVVDGVTTAHVLDTKKNYGNKYADGLLPVGDSKYVTDAAKKGYVYVCNANFVPASQAGAQTRGPWFTNNNTQWNSNKKAAVQGKVTWEPSLSNKLEAGKRVITTNDLPNHTTGVFPVAANDPARSYDANPNTIKAQSLTYSLAGSPEVLEKSGCMTGEVGVMLTGIALFNAFDAGGRDAGAWEVQDGCDGHPQSAGAYHYHSLSRCIPDVSVQKVIGFALDGFPITGPKVGENNVLTTDDLDECHGITSQITLDGKKVNMYHYVMTQDFPYSVSCFRGTAVKPPGQPEGGQGGTQTPPPAPGTKPSPGLPPPPQ